MRLDERDTEEIRKALVPAFAVALIVNHVPRVGQYGESCDEMGCGFCNAGLDGLEDTIRMIEVRGYDLTEMLDAIEAMTEEVRASL